MNQTERRSKRSNKGTHSFLERERQRESELVSQWTIKNKRTKTDQTHTHKILKRAHVEAKTDKAIDSDIHTEYTTSEGVVRCVCVPEDLDHIDNENLLWLECESCTTWQHSYCILGINDEAHLPKYYQCHNCNPSNYPNGSYLTFLKNTLNTVPKPISDSGCGIIPAQLSIEESLATHLFKIKNSIRKTVILAIYAALIQVTLPQSFIELNPEFARDYAIQVENELYNDTHASGDDTPNLKYKNIFKIMLLNLRNKKNNGLKNGIINNEISPSQLLNKYFHHLSQLQDFRLEAQQLEVPLNNSTINMNENDITRINSHGHNNPSGDKSKVQKLDALNLMMASPHQSTIYCNSNTTITESEASSPSSLTSNIKHAIISLPSTVTKEDFMHNDIYIKDVHDHEQHSPKLNINLTINPNTIDVSHH